MAGTHEGMFDMQRTRWLVVLMALVAALATVAAGCGSDDSGGSGSSNAASASSDKPEKDEIVVQGASPVPNLGYIAMYVADKEGFLKDEGINKLKIIYGNGDSVAFQALNSGQSQVVSGTPEPLITGYDEGLRGRIFYQVYKQLIYSIGVPADGPITDVSQLDGKKIGVSSSGSTAIQIAKSMLRQAGLDEDAAEFVPVGTGQPAFAALKSGKVQALALWDTPFAELEGAGLKLRYFHDPTLGHVGDGGYFTSDRNIKEVPNMLKAWTRAITRALIFIRDNPDQALQDFWEVSPDSRPQGSDAEALQKGRIELKRISASLDLSGKPKPVDPKALSTYIEEFKRQGLIDEAPPVDAFYTNQFVPIAKEAAAKANAESGN